jgi:hypothetical protein
MAARNNIDRDVIANPGEPVRQHRKKKKHEVPAHLKGTRMAKLIQNGKKVPAMPHNKTLEEIYEMDQDDPAFKNPGSRPRTTGLITPEKARSGEHSYIEIARADKQKRANERRARARKGEAVVTKAVEVLHDQGGRGRVKKKKGVSGKMEKVYDEEAVVAEGILNLDDWDDEELIRGYRRTRSGRFGQPPKFIPKEIQQEIFRRIAGRGDSKMRAAYLESIDGLVDLAHNSTSDKVRLDAIRELMNRVVGKVPDRVHIAQEQPYEQFLGDAIVPIGDEWEPEPQGEAVDLPALPPGDTPPPTGADWAGTKGAKEMPDG